jgi:DNA modification methylase
MSVTILVGDVLDKLATLEDESVHCVVTSPPYWGLRDYGVDGQLGLEPTVEEYVEKMVAVFVEVKRVLRKDGTLWLNMGDAYAGGGRGQGAPDCKQRTNKGSCNDTIRAQHFKAPGGLKPKDLVGQPWRLAFALQADGWWLRNDIIWSKPNPMPEAVRDRATKAHEYIFLMTKAARYFFDQEAVREKAQYGRREHTGEMRSVAQDGRRHTTGSTKGGDPSAGRNIRSVWTIPTQPFPEAHFATFPEELPRRCIAAGTSEKGCCPKCGAPWVRVVETERRNPISRPDRQIATGGAISGGTGKNFPERRSRTAGWKRGCRHKGNAVPCTVLDPFSGAGTTGLVAVKMGRSYIGIEINPEYAEMADRRICDSLPLLIGD